MQFLFLLLTALIMEPMARPPPPLEEIQSMPGDTEADCTPREQDAVDVYSLLQTSNEELLRLGKNFESSQDGGPSLDDVSFDVFPATIFLLIVMLLVCGCYWGIMTKRFVSPSEGRIRTPRIQRASSDGNLERKEPGERVAKGTLHRMPNLPPTARARSPKGELKPMPLFSAPSSAVAAGSSANKTTRGPDDDSDDSRGVSLPPPLVDDFMSSSESSDTDADEKPWTISYEECQSFINGGSSAVVGSVPLHASQTNTGQIVLSRDSDPDKVVATLGPLSSSGVKAELFGPGDELYGSFAQQGSSFVVHHKEHEDPVLLLKFAKPSNVGYLEVEGQDGMPLGKVKLPESSSHCVEIDGTPDLDYFLLIISVLACIASNPGLVAVPQAGAKGSVASPSSVEEDPQSRSAQQ